MSQITKKKCDRCGKPSRHIYRVGNQSRHIYRVGNQFLCGHCHHTGRTIK